VKKAAPADGAEADGEEEQKEEAKPAPPTKAEEAALAKNKQLSAKAKQYLVFLQREKQVNAVVEFVFSASRFKLLVPKEHVMLSFSLAGIRTPSAKTEDGKVDPLSEEILQYVRSKVQQHSVRIEVETMDKADNFLGSMFHNRVNLAVDLLQQGYASIFGFSAAKSPYSKDLYAAERAAKEARKGIWANWVEPTPEEKANMDPSQREEEDSKDNGSERTVRITEIVDCTDFYVQYVGDKNAEAVEKALAAVAAQPEAAEPFSPPANANGRSFIAAGQFSDDSWHRVRCDGLDSNGDWNVYFIDYGNHDTLLVDRLRHLPAEATKIPALAIHSSLAGLSAPRAPEYQEGSAVAFSEMAFGLELKATIEFGDKFGRKHLTLSHESHPISVNRQMLRDGWARVQSRPDRRIQKLVHDLQEEENYAKRNHYNVFEYGDISSEDESSKDIKGPDPKDRSQKKPLPVAKK
jgi:staphylococcal nuclease domain-containing protein 1